MMRIHVLLGLLLLVPATVGAQTQTTDCSRDYFGNVHCTTQQQQGVNWGILQPVDINKSVQQGWDQGVRAMQQIQQGPAATVRKVSRKEQAESEAHNEANLREYQRSQEEHYQATVRAMEAKAAQDTEATDACANAYTTAIFKLGLSLAKVVDQQCKEDFKRSHSWLGK